METSPYANNSPFIYSLLSCLVKKKCFHGNVGTYENWGSSLSITAWGSSVGGRSLKIHIEIKREVFTNLIPDKHSSRTK
jgi:hypothetical protein